MTLTEKTRRAAEHATKHYELRQEMHQEMVESLRAMPTATQLDLARTYVAGLRAYIAIVAHLADDLERVTNELVKEVS